MPGQVLPIGRTRLTVAHMPVLRVLRTYLLSFRTKIDHNPDTSYLNLNTKAISPVARVSASCGHV